jgi:hypothetical protein
MDEAQRLAGRRRLVELQRRLEAATPAPAHAPVDELNERIRRAEERNPQPARTNAHEG